MESGWMQILYIYIDLETYRYVYIDFYLLLLLYIYTQLYVNNLDIFCLSLSVCTKSLSKGHLYGLQDML